MVQSLGGVALAFGAIGILSSLVFMSSLEYPSPPFPAGYMAWRVLLLVEVLL